MVTEAAAGFNIHQAKTQLSRIVERVEHGEEIILSRAGVPVAKVVPVPKRAGRSSRGSLRGRLKLSPTWDSEETNEIVADLLEGRS